MPCVVMQWTVWFQHFLPLWRRRIIVPKFHGCEALSPLVFPAFTSKWPSASSCPGMILDKQRGSAVIQQRKRAPALLHRSAHVRAVFTTSVEILQSLQDVSGVRVSPCVGVFLPWFY